MCLGGTGFCFKTGSRASVRLVGIDGKTYIDRSERYRPVGSNAQSFLEEVKIINYLIFIPTLRQAGIAAPGIALDGGRSFRYHRTVDQIVRLGNGITTGY